MTVIFDFDSTLITGESLELLLAEQLKNQLEKMAAITKLTDQGMNGEIPFLKSLQQRLEIAAPNQQQVIAFAKQLTALITPGMPELIDQLKQRGHDIWIISGGLQEILLASAEVLGIAKTNIYGVNLNWDSHGNYAGINSDDAFSQSKLIGAKSLAKEWLSPSIIIGDGFTDYEVFKHGLTDYFIAFTAHHARQSILDLNCHRAENMDTLKKMLIELSFL